MFKSQWTDGLSLLPNEDGVHINPYLCSGGDGGGSDGQGNQNEAQNAVDVQQMNADITGDSSKYNRMAEELAASAPTTFDDGSVADIYGTEPTYYDGPRGVQVSALEDLTPDRGLPSVGSPEVGLQGTNDTANINYFEERNAINDQGIFGGLFNDDYTYNPDTDMTTTQSFGQGVGSLLGSSIIPGLSLDVRDVTTFNGIYDPNRTNQTYTTDFNPARAALGIAGGLVGGQLLGRLPFNAGASIGENIGKTGYDLYNDKPTSFGGSLISDFGGGVGSAVGQIAGPFGEKLGGFIGDEAASYAYDLASKDKGRVEDVTQNKSFGQSFLNDLPDMLSFNDDDDDVNSTFSPSNPNINEDDTNQNAFNDGSSRNTYTATRKPTSADPLTAPALQIASDTPQASNPTSTSSSGRQPLPEGVSYSIPYGGYADKGSISRSLRRDGWGSMINA